MVDGGEAFKNSYETVQELGYNSTEAHNSYLQIFVEAGIIGFLSVILIITVSLKTKKLQSKYLSTAFIGLILHLVVDLGFSYLLVIIYFGIFIGLFKDKEGSLAKESSKGITYIFAMINTFVIFTSFVIALFANIAFYMEISAQPENSSDIEKNVEVIYRLEKAIKLDFSDISYRKKLNKEYFNYMSNLEDYLKSAYIEKEGKEDVESRLKAVVSDIKENTDKIYEYDKFSYATLKYVNDIYIKYMDYFIDAFYSEDEATGREEYTKFINQNIDWVRNNISNEANRERILDKMNY